MTTLPARRLSATREINIAPYYAEMEAKRVLFLAAEPTDAVRLRLGQEQREIRTALQLSNSRDSLELYERSAVRPADLTQAMHDVRPHIVHFSGHGASSGALCFEDEMGRTQPVGPEALAALFRLFHDDIEAVVLNACYSATQADALARTVPYVVGMSAAIADNAAIAFSAGFYKALGAKRDYRDAFDFGKTEIHLYGLPDHVTPVLHGRQALDPVHVRAGKPPKSGAYARFHLPYHLPGRDRDNSVFVDVERLLSVRDIIETLYEHYLADYVPPLTYGSEWIIRNYWNPAHLLAPPAWVAHPHEPAHRMAGDWADSMTAVDADILPGSGWQLTQRSSEDRPLVSHAAAFRSTDMQLLGVLRRDMKGQFVLEDRFRSMPDGSLFETAPPEQVVVLETTEGHGQYFVDEGGEIPKHARYFFRRHSPR